MLTNCNARRMFGLFGQDKSKKKRSFEISDCAYIRCNDNPFEDNAHKLPRRIHSRTGHPLNTFKEKGR